MAIFDFCSQVNTYINQQFALRRAKWSCSIEKLSDFSLGQHTITMEQARRLRVLVQDIQVEKMTILALVGAKPLESNVDMLLVSIDGLSHTDICPCQWTQETGRICYHGLAAIYRTTSAWIGQMSIDDLMWYSLPYHVTTLQNMYGPIPVLPTVRSHNYHRTKMTGTKVVVNSMISRNTNSIIQSRILSMVVDFSFINYNSSFHQDF